MIEEALAVARPKAMYREAFIKEKGEDYVVIEGLKFISSILRINLGEVYKVYPYIATSGVKSKNGPNPKTVCWKFSGRRDQRVGLSIS